MTNTQRAKLLAALDVQSEGLGRILAAVLHVFGVLDVAVTGTLGAVDETVPGLPGTGARIGDLIAVYSHQRVRVAVVWAVTPSKVSGVYVSPSELERATKSRGPIRFHEVLAANSITARKLDVVVVGHLDERGMPVDVRGDVEDAPEVDDEAEVQALADKALAEAPERAEDLLRRAAETNAHNGALAGADRCSRAADLVAARTAAPVAGGVAGARAADLPLPGDGALFGLLDVPVVGALF